MLGLIISAAIASEQRFNKAVPAARARSAFNVAQLNANPNETAAVVNRLTQPYASCPSDKVPNWKAKLVSMTGCYSFGGNFIYHMRPAMDGVLIVAELVLTPFWGTGLGSVSSYPNILNSTFFIFEDPQKRMVYVHSFHATQREHLLAARIFGEELLELIPYTQVQVPMPTEVEKKGWWKRTFG